MMDANGDNVCVGDNNDTGATVIGSEDGNDKVDGDKTDVNNQKRKKNHNSIIDVNQWRKKNHNIIFDYFNQFLKKN